MKLLGATFSIRSLQYVFVISSLCAILAVILRPLVYTSKEDNIYTTYLPPKKELTKAGTHRENATLVVLCRNDDLEDVLSSMQSLEDRFNKRYHYPWLFLNEVPFTNAFKNATGRMTDSKIEFVTLAPEEWELPTSIDLTQLAHTLRVMTENQVIYGGSLSYRLMCRFNSGFFFRVPKLLQYDYYWRVEPGIKFHCDLDYDPFTFMREHDKMYGFVIAIREFPNTIPTLWHHTHEFFRKNPELLARDNSLPFIEDYGMGLDGMYNLCHFWSNFEIANLNFFRSDAYMKYFNYLDSQKGFFYERWGDAPVHSLAAALMLNKSQLHYFEDMGYFHPPWSHCPLDEESHTSGRCLCNRDRSFANNPYSCFEQWHRNMQI
ncbi:alpha-1,2-mannosyltransferase [Schizosaccharomyces japonicus yFS275]|uniref:Alpha-1,2-mannosyltransferase n=1 Tax=Schizosaccharomyces japonicus (strain yFS275 / FY16936) TaxID=402676 RepID=B6JX96_SCHJY|nr:alpha-1,2-mannosyltransferase [Schizosaccharomyces japonicus yFS275]EEB05997.1 alpha-1,2-mannosyltransferase [Schizosaccharomyces japonicus yFS275]